MKKYFRENRLQLLLLLCFPFGMSITAVSASSEDFSEWYALHIYPLFSRSIGLLSGLVPFSIAELVLAGMVVGGLALLAGSIVRTVRERRFRPVARLFLFVASLASVIYLVFVLFCGINYHRKTFTTYSGLEIQPSGVEELTQLSSDLIDQMNQTREQCASGEDGCMAIGGVFETSKRVGEAFADLGQKYPVLAGGPFRPKPVLLSPVMSYTQITGIFFPFTFESNVNVAIPDFSIPSTMCHELAHNKGFMREDEANFVAYLTSTRSGDPALAYSGYMLAGIHAMNALYGADYEAFSALQTRYSEAVRRDLVENSRYWQAHEGPVAEVSNAVNDTYLKANLQTDGVKSYGRMVDLLLAEHRERASGGNG